MNPSNVKVIKWFSTECRNKLQIKFLNLRSSKKTLHLLKIDKNCRKSISSIAAYHHYINPLCLFMWLLKLSNTYIKKKSIVWNEIRAGNWKNKTFVSSKIIYSLIQLLQPSNKVILWKLFDEVHLLSRRSHCSKECVLSRLRSYTHFE